MTIGSTTVGARPASTTVAPYVGLRPFERSEANIFYGRGEHIAEMLRVLRKQHFLAVVGSSGSGKSSLVRAGLLPAIAAGFFDASGADWRFVIMRPGRQPYDNLLDAILQEVSPGEADGGDSEFRRVATDGRPDAVLVAANERPAQPVVMTLDHCQACGGFERALDLHADEIFLGLQDGTTGDEHGTVTLWDANTGKLLWSLSGDSKAGHQGAVQDVAFTSDGKQMTSNVGQNNFAISVR